MELNAGGCGVWQEEALEVLFFSPKSSKVSLSPGKSEIERERERGEYERGERRAGAQGSMQCSPCPKPQRRFRRKEG